VNPTVGFNNPVMPWSELERTLSDRRRPDGPPPGVDGGDSPAWSRKRGKYEPAEEDRPHRPDGPTVAYAELHMHSHFSFLDGASSPEALVEEACRLGIDGLALTDHDGLYGVVRMTDAAVDYGMATIYGAELSLDLTVPQNGVADPEGSHLLVLAQGEEGYHRLAGAITTAQLRGGEKGRPRYDLEELAATADGYWTVLTGCRKGTVRQALTGNVGGGTGEAAARHELDRLTHLFGADHVVVELFDHGHPLASDLNDALYDLAGQAKLPVVATNNVHYASPSEYRLAPAVAAARARRSLDEMDGWLPAAGSAHLRSGAEMAARFARYPGSVARTMEYAGALSFDLLKTKPKLPRQEVPPGHTSMTWLRELTRRGALVKYPNAGPAVLDRLDRELAVIEEKDFPGYFLIVHDIVAFARQRGILCQGRGSAANSAVCYALDITAVDSIFYDLPFERFLSATRDEEPDIDVDFDSDRREEVIQHVYAKYGRHNAAQVANVISYRPRSAVRDMAKALGHSTGQQDAWSKQIETWGGVAGGADNDVPRAVVDLAQSLLTAPRHLGIHSGGMVLTERPVGEVCPIEHGRMENRTVLQWDKDDCARMGLVKFDLLGLGMLGALQHSFDLADEHLGERWNMSTLPKEEAGVYDMLCRADSVGVFQVESRAQMGTLPRLRPRRFYDLAIEIALIRPGPIQGGAVHPYIRRKLKKETVTYLHPKLEPVLERTLGVPLFQEQLMQMAMAVGGCTGDDADLLRRAMGSKRGIVKIGKLKAKLYAGMAENGITGVTADEIYAKIEAFANFGFAESHAISFALLVYASSWMRLHYPAAFTAALLRSQPMGFYSPQTLVADARRHGVEVRRPDISRSGAHATLEVLDGHEPGPTGDDACLDLRQPPVPNADGNGVDVFGLYDFTGHRRDGNHAMRLGLAGVTSIGEKLAEEIVTGRDTGGPFTGMADLARRIELRSNQIEALATAGAFACFGLTVREALWLSGQAAQESPDRLAGMAVLAPPPMLPGMSPAEQTMADLWATDISPVDHPIVHLRDYLDERGALPISALSGTDPGRRIRVGGVVTHRQRPGTAGGVTFINIEDETGMLNVICTPGLWGRYRRIGRDSKALIVRGILEKSEGVTNLVADELVRLPLSVPVRSRDFR